MALCLQRYLVGIGAACVLMVGGGGMGMREMVLCLQQHLGGMGEGGVTCLG